MYWRQNYKECYTPDVLNLLELHCTNCKVHRYLCNWMRQNNHRIQQWTRPFLKSPRSRCSFWNYIGVLINNIWRKKTIYILYIMFTYGMIPVATSEKREARSKHCSCPALQDWVHFAVPPAHWVEHSGRFESNPGWSHKLQIPHVSSQLKLAKYLQASTVNWVATSSSILKSEKICCYFFSI